MLARVTLSVRNAMGRLPKSLFFLFSHLFFIADTVPVLCPSLWELTLGTFSPLSFANLGTTSVSVIFYPLKVSL